MKILRVKMLQPLLLIVFVNLLVVTGIRAQFRSLYGTASDNAFSEIIPDGQQFYALGVEDDKATVSRIAANGQLLWTVKMLYGSVFTDGVVESSGDLLVTGFSTNFASDNFSLLCRVTPGGVISSVHTYHTPGFEGFLRIIPTSSTTYSVMGVQTVNGNEDVVLLDISSTGTVLLKQVYQYPGNDQFYYDYERILPNRILLAGISAASKGIIYQVDASGNFVSAVQEPSSFVFRDVAALPPPFTAGDFVAGGTPTGSGQTPRLIHFDGNLFPVWDVFLNGLNSLEQVVVAQSGEIYVVGRGVFNGLDRAVILKIIEVSGAPVLLWAKFIETGAISHMRGNMALTQGGKIAFTEEREHNGPVSLGNADAFLAVTGPDLISYCTKPANVTLSAYTNFFESPDIITPGMYDPPQMLSGLDWQNVSWQRKFPCTDPTPVISCANLRVLVEPEQDGREVWYDETIRTEGDDLALFCDPPSGSVFAVGATDVHCTVTNPSGDTASCSFTVTVEKMPYDSLQPPAPLSPEGIFDRVRDRFGNPYRLGDLQIPDTSGSSLLCLNSGYFNLFFEQGCGMEGASAEHLARRDVLCQLFSDLSDFITPANPAIKVNIWVRDLSRVQGVPTPATAGIAGIGTSFYSMPAGVGGIVEGEVWKTINSGADSYSGLVSPFTTTGGAGAGFYHGMVAFNFVNPGIDWHTDLATATDSSLYDLYTVALREATHALGFASLIGPEGQSVFAPVFAGYFSRYDTYLQSGAGQPLITQSGACPEYDYQFNPAVNPGVLQPDSSDCLVNQTVCATAIQFAGTVNQKVYTPNCFEPGRSLSHLEELCRAPAAQANDQYYVLSNGSGAGAAFMKRFFKPEERQVLCDIGYKVEKIYGNAGQFTFTNYAGGICPGLGVAGVNEGITSAGTYAYTTNVSTPITIDDILANDYQAVSFECLQVISGDGTVSTSSGTAFTYTPKENPGIALLRYVPVGSGGEKGNAAYVFIRVRTPPCPAAACNMLGDGGFEQGTCGIVDHLPPGFIGDLYCWEALTGGNYLFTRSCTNFQFEVNGSLGLPDTWNGSPNDQYVYMAGGYSSSTSYAYSSSMQTTLATPITQNNIYTASFWAWGAYPVGNGPNVLIAASPSALQINQPLHASFFQTSVLGNPTVKTFSLVYVPTPGWTFYTATFSYLSGPPLNNLIVANYDPPGISSSGVFYIDDITLIQHSFILTFTPPTLLCQTAAPLNLNSFATPAGGTFTGPGVANNIFNPGIGPGTHVITYTVIDGNGCPVSTTAAIQVVAPPTVTFTPPPSPVCQTAASITLNGTATPPGGAFTGTGVINLGGVYSFDPGAAGPGAHVITYTVTNICTATATASVQVLPASIVTFTPPSGPICLTSEPTDLNAFVTPVGGTFSGPGVLNNFFHPLAAGVGPHTITYTFGSPPCQSVLTAVFHVMRCDACDISNICLDFDGTDDYVSATNPLNTPVLQNNFTVACWFNDQTTGGPNDFHRIYGLGWDKRFELGDRNGYLTFLTGVSTTWIRNTGWHHAAAVNANGLVTVYLDGQPVPGLIGLNVGIFSGPPVLLKLGQWAFSNGQPFWQGQVDEFKIWSTALTQAQVQDEMQCSLDPNNANLLLHFPFDQYVASGNNLGNFLADNVVTGGTDGVLINFALNGNTSNWVDHGRELLRDCNVGDFAWLEGLPGRDIPGRTKVFDADIFTAGIENLNGQNLPTLTRRRSDGSIVWRCVINRPGSINDFIRTDGGCYLLVGHLGNFAGDNRSFIAQVDHLGALTWLDEYNLGLRESFNRIIRSDNPNPATCPYIVCGITTTNPASGRDDILLFCLDGQGQIGWLQQYGNSNTIDCEFRYDLMNYAGGYLLTGHTYFGAPNPVLFFTDNLGNQWASSTQYQANINFFDVEPAATGTDILIAGQLTNTGDAILAKVDANGVPIWGRVFPRLTVFRKLVVRPNGDIFAVGQRDALAQYRNVIVKVQDLPNGPSILWQKNAELPWYSETNWTPADLVWYSGDMFFLTEGRLNHDNGWGNEDIGAVMYALDQPVDTCPLTKETPVFNNFNLAPSPMPGLTAVVFTPNPPLTSNPWFPVTLLRDSLCIDTCDCFFSNLGFRKTFPSLPFWSVPVSGCGVAAVTLPGCPDKTGPIRFGGQLKCKGLCSFTSLSWTLKDPNNNLVASGSFPTPAFTIFIGLAMVQIPGTYSIELTGKCGMETCTCTVKFIMPACPPACDCLQPAFSNVVNSGFSWLQLPGCAFQFTPKYLGPCDAVTWTLTPLGGAPTTFANSTGNQTVTYGFSNGQYSICMKVTRTLPNNTTCTAARCQSFNFNCTLFAQPPESLASGESSCDGSFVQNNGFVIGAEAGGLADIGKVDSWDYSGGNPEVALEAGKLDTNLMRLRGNGGFADLLYQDSLPISIWDSVDFSMALRPIQALMWPGTELVVRLSAQRQDSLWCNDESTCLEIMRVPLPLLDTSEWLLAGSFATVKTTALPYLTIHVENPFIDDDVALQSVVDIDNVCLSGYDIVSVKQPWAGKGAIQVFPNPNTGTFSVKLPEAATAGMAFRITDLTGRLLKEKQTEAGSVLQTMQAGDLPAGLYFLQVLSGGRVLATEKFVKY